MKFSFLIFVFVLSDYPLEGVSVFKINVPPAEVHKFTDLVDGSDLDAIQYAPKTNENDVPLTRNSVGEFVYKNRIIKNPTDFIEEHYDIHDYHGQDGLGQYLYGYEDSDQAKNEKRDLNGTINGAYKYRRSDGGEIIVTYYADATGFHADGNRPMFQKSSLLTKTAQLPKAEEDHFNQKGELIVSEGYADENKKYDDDRRYESTDEVQQRNIKKNSYVPKDAKDDPKGFFYANDFNLPLLRNKEKSAN